MKRCVLTLCGTPQREYYGGLQPYGHNAGGTTIVPISVAYLFRLAELDRLMADRTSFVIADRLSTDFRAPAWEDSRAWPS
jgi:hypothetical protein